MAGTRASLWLRWPDKLTGPLWLGLHLNERAGESVLVGVELWTEEPGSARQSLGPDGDPTDDLLPWPPTAVRAEDISSLTLSAIGVALRAALLASVSDPMADALASALGQTRSGRPPLYPPEHYDRVAGVYLRAVDSGSRSPTLDVARAWGVSRSAAAKWVMRARREGSIPRRPTWRSPGAD